MSYSTSEIEIVDDNLGVSERITNDDTEIIENNKLNILKKLFVLKNILLM